MGAHIFAFFPTPGANFVLSFSLWGSSRGIVVAVQGHGPPKVRVWASWESFCASPSGLQAAVVSPAGTPRVPVRISEMTPRTGAQKSPKATRYELSLKFGDPSRHQSPQTRARELPDLFLTPLGSERDF